METPEEKLEDKVNVRYSGIRPEAEYDVSGYNICNAPVIDQQNTFANNLNLANNSSGSVENFKPSQSLTNKKVSKEKSIKKCVPNKSNKHPVTENQERINYLFLASSFLNNSEYSSNMRNVSASLGTMSMAIGRKCVLRMSPALKRQMCKGCGSSILPAVSSICRLRKNRQKHLVLTCNKCKTIKRFITNGNYMLWSENPKSVI